MKRGLRLLGGGMGCLGRRRGRYAMGLYSFILKDCEALGWRTGIVKGRQVVLGVLWSSCFMVLFYIDCNISF